MSELIFLLYDKKLLLCGVRSQATQQEVRSYGRTETPAVIRVQVVATNIEHTDQWDGLRKRCQRKNWQKDRGEGRGRDTRHGIVKPG